MARVNTVLMDPKDTVAIVDTLNRVIQVVDQEIEVGDPNDPQNEDSGVKPTGLAATHNGRLSNVRGSWVEMEFTARNSAVNFVHNLNIPVHNNGAVNEPNVRWLGTNLRHSGLGAGPGSIMTVMYTDLDAASITANSLPLRLYASAARTIDGVDNPVRVSIFFIPAVRWP